VPGRVDPLAALVIDPITASPAGVECSHEHSSRERCTLSDEQQITWDPEADRRIKRSPFLMRRFIRKRIEERVASRGRTHVTEADVDESASMYRQYRFK
jgi:proto-chlorophyllide reductase subunit